MNGDIVHVAHEEFRFGLEGADLGKFVGGATEVATTGLPVSIVRANQHLEELLDNLSVHAVFQPIVDLHTHEIFGFEALGRGHHRALSSNPRELFHLAEKFQLAVNLSQAFRAKALEQSDCLPKDALIFCNLHPAEIENCLLLDHIRKLRRFLLPNQRMILEIHENAVHDLNTVRKLSTQLHGEGIGLAYDDFGVGQARFLELADVPPDFIKLDLTLVRDIHLDQARQEVVGGLCQLIRSRGVKLIAEGIEKLAEAAVCKRLGCHYGQGFLFGRPQPVLPELTWLKTD